MSSAQLEAHSRCASSMIMPPFHLFDTFDDRAVNGRRSVAPNALAHHFEE